MRIPGYFYMKYEPPAPFVETIFIHELHKIEKSVHMLIDSGASTTIILDKDVKSLGLDVTRLRKSENKVGGVGGTIDTYILENCKLLFETSEKKVYQEYLDILVGVHDLSKLDEDSGRRVLRLPSLLGRDIIRKFRFIEDERKNEVYLE